jgi:hypothetical protein
MGIEWPWERTKDHRCRWPITERRVWSLGVVILAPSFDHNLGPLEAVEDFTVEQLVSEPSVEGFTVTVFPRTARLDEQLLGPELLEPGPDDLGGHLRSIVGANMFRDAPFEHDIGEGLDHAEVVDPPYYRDGQTFTGVLVDQGHQSQCSAVMHLGDDEVITPHMIVPLGSEPDTGAVVKPKPAPRTLFLGNFQALLTPDAPDAVYADGLPIIMERRRDPVITIPAIFRP